MLTEKQLSCMHRCQGWVLENPWAKNLPTIKSHSEFSSLKNFQKAKHTQVFGCTLFAELRGWDMREPTTKSSDCFKFPKISLLKSPNYFRIFLPEKFRNRKFQSQKILRTTLSLEVEIAPPRASLLHKINISHVLS